MRILHFVTGGFSGATQVAIDLCLAAQLAFRTYFTGHTGNFRCKGAELVHHRVNGVL